MWFQIFSGGYTPGLPLKRVGNGEGKGRRGKERRGGRESFVSLLLKAKLRPYSRLFLLCMVVNLYLFVTPSVVFSHRWPGPQCKSSIPRCIVKLVSKTGRLIHLVARCVHRTIACLLCRQVKSSTLRRSALCPRALHASRRAIAIFNSLNDNNQTCQSVKCTDANQVSTPACLLQWKWTTETNRITYASRTFDHHETNYCATKKRWLPWFLG